VAAALFVMLNKLDFLSNLELNSYRQYKIILGGHPDRTKVSGVEARKLPLVLPCDMYKNY
jgi:transketolase N-terminal domain/subunit